MILDKQTRKAIQEDNNKKSLRQDTKQHCLKILQGIGKFDENTAHRAIWELVQNARDLANEIGGKKQVSVKIVLTEDELSFSHNGKHFNFDCLSSLIKQVSSEEKEDPDAAGQFGTGFMTTHKFSRKLYINGSYEVAPDTYVSLDGFLIDRSADELSSMRDSMTQQLLNVNNLMEKDTSSTKEEWTEFVYLTDTEDRKDAAQQGVKSAMELMPYVMTFNERIVECSIQDKDGSVTVFKKEQQNDVEGLHVMRIWKNKVPIDCFYLQSDDKKDIIILPLQKALEAKKLGPIPRLFIFFPLLGTEANSINYVFHSERFFPTETRDLIVLPDGNAEHQYKIDKDMEVLKEMSSMLFDYLKVHANQIKNSIYLAPIGFDMVLRKEKTMEFFKSRHKAWVEVFKNLPLIELDDDSVSIEQTDKVKVLDHNIVEFLKQDENEKYLDVVYEYASMVSALPKKEQILEWSDIVYQWNPDEAKWYVTIEAIVEQIKSMGDGEALLRFLEYLKASGQSHYFKTKAIIPNREGTLCSFSGLRNGKDIPEKLYNVCKPLVPEFTSKLIDERFVGLDEFASFTRDDLKSALSKYVEEQEQLEEPLKDHLPDVLRFCMTFPTSNPENNDRYKAISVISEKYQDVPFEVNYVQHLGDVDKEQLMYKVVFDALVKYEFQQIAYEAKQNENWYKEEPNSNYLFNLLNSLSNIERPTLYQSKIMPDYAIFPNQNGMLCEPSSLFVLENDPNHHHGKADIEDLCSFCIDVTGEDKRDHWADERFAGFQPFQKEGAKSIANAIDEKLKSQNYSPNTFMKILDHLDQEEEIWCYWFSNINDNKANIFLNRIQGQQKAHVYTIMKTEEGKLEKLANLAASDEEKLKKLADLAANEKMDRIIEEGLKAVALLDFQGKHDCFIRELGQYVETLLLDQLKGQINDKELSVEVSDQQGGQDYIVRLEGEEVYYVEVKSRWTTSDVVEMSPLQFKNSVDHKERYSLCFVDMTWKNTNDVGEREYDDIETCLNHTKVLHDIGKRNEWCIESVQQTKERPHIGGSYSLTVPQELFKQENTPTFDDLIKRIKGVLEQKISTKDVK